MLDNCETNPFEKLPKPNLAKTRDRVLDDGELRAILSAAGTMKRYGEIVRLLILTGQRAGQIARLHQDWIDDEERIVHFPAWVRKNKTAHSVPFGSLFKTVTAINKPVEGYLFSPPNMAGVAFSGLIKE